MGNLLKLINIYLKISNISIDDIEKCILPVAAARLVEWLPETEKRQLLKIVDDKLSEI